MLPSGVEYWSAVWRDSSHSQPLQHKGKDSLRRYSKNQYTVKRNNFFFYFQSSSSKADGPSFRVNSSHKNLLSSSCFGHGRMGIYIQTRFKGGLEAHRINTRLINKSSACCALCDLVSELRKHAPRPPSSSPSCLYQACFCHHGGSPLGERRIHRRRWGFGWTKRHGDQWGISLLSSQDRGRFLPVSLETKCWERAKASLNLSTY